MWRGIWRERLRVLREGCSVRRWVSRLSIKYKLLASYTLLVIVPFAILFALGGLASFAIKNLNPVAQRPWVQLLPSSLNGIIINQSSAMIYKNLHAEQPDFESLRLYTSLLEWEGLNIVVRRGEQVVYLTPGKGSVDLLKELEARPRPKRQDLPLEAQQIRGINRISWDDNELRYVVVVPENNWEFFGKGEMLFLANSVEAESTSRILTELTMGFGILTFFGFVWYCGFIIARRMSNMILKPVNELRDAARAVREGDWTTPIEAKYDDEIGEMCKNFDAMRVTLQEQAEAKARYEQQRRMMLAGIGHDLATPLTAVNGFATGILQGLAKTPEQERHYVELIAARAKVMTGLVENLRAFSKLDMGNLPITLQKVNLVEYFMQYIDERSDMYAERGLRFWSSLPAERLFVNIDGQQFERVVTNIIENALKYAGPSALAPASALEGFENACGDNTDSVNMDFSISVQRKGFRVHVVLGDFGQGVEDNELEKLFDIFYRTDSSRTNIANGSGLGLAIVKQLITSMSGTVVAKNRPEGGLEVHIELPLQGV